MSQPSEFEEKFNQLIDLIIKEIAKDTELEIKVIKVEALTEITHSLCEDRFSLEYNEKVNQLNKSLEESGNSATLNTPSRKKRLNIMMKWLSLMIKEYPQFKLDANLNKVDFG